MARRASGRLPREPEGLMELNYPHCPSICPRPLATERAPAASPRHSAQLENPPILLILGLLRCDKIAT